MINIINLEEDIRISYINSKAEFKEARISKLSLRLMVELIVIGACGALTLYYELIS